MGILKNRVDLILFLLIAWILSSCSSTRYVPEGSYMLDKVEFVSDNKDFAETELKTYLRQEPNFKVFGLYKLYLSFYNMSGKDSTKWRNRQFRKIGEPPVIYEPYLTEKSESELEKFLQTKGYINAKVKAWPEYKHNKKVKLTYYLKTNEPYKVRNVSYNFSADPQIDSIYSEFGQKESLLKQGMLFDTDVLDDERERIDQMLKRRGYYYFNKDYLSYTADSTWGTHEVDICLNLKPYMVTLPDGSVEESHHHKYTIRNVNVLTLKDSRSVYNPSTQYDTLKFRPSMNILYEDRPLFRPKVLDDEVRIYPGLPYSSFFVDRTYSHLNSLGAVRSTNIQFVNLLNDQDQLDCFVLISPAKSQSFSLDLEGTNSWGDLGFALNGGYQHKNVFRGSELLSLKGRYAQEAYSGITNILSEHTMDVGGELSLNFPRLILPFVNRSFRQRINAQTEFSLGANYQTRPNTYKKTSSTLAMRYLWNMRRYYRYCFDVVDLNYVNINTHPDFDALYSAPKYSVLRDSYSDHFILSSGFSVVYDNQQNQKALHKTYFKFAFESAGNLLYGVNKLTNESTNEDGYYEIAGITYSQYAKAEISISENKYIDRKNRIVYHLGFGIAYPYGNAQIVPFEKRFFSGGANSVRGWSVRTLGPGSYFSDDKDDFVKQSGDIKLDLNIEHRTKLFWKIEMAAFVDAGNVWTIREYESQSKGYFRFDKFYNEIALAYGLGLRFDFNFFLLRFDLGVKAYDPSLPQGECWRFEGLNWSDDFAFHFAIGYPF